MSCLCSICQDFLTERPQSITPTGELVISALRCGHIFHMVCVEQWFRSSAERTRNGGEPRDGICPCCKMAVSLSTALRVFPTGDEESNSIVEQKKTIDNVLAENQKLTSKINETQQQLIRVSSELEDEQLAHDMLKMEYARTLSEVQAFQEQMRDDSEVKATLENSAKMEIEKLGKEKKDALRAIAEMEARERKLLAEMELLRINDKENINTAFQRGQGSLPPREKTQNQSKAIGVMIMKPGPSCNNETSDGESLSGSPSTSQPKEHCMPLDVPLSISFSGVNEPTQSDCY